MTKPTIIEAQFIDLYAHVLAFANQELTEPIRQVTAQVIQVMAPLAAALLLRDRAAPAPAPAAEVKPEG